MNWKQKFTQTKDKATAMGLRALLATKMNDYAKIDSLELDSKSKTLQVVLRLKGEEDNPVSIQISAYELKQKGENWVLIIQHCHCSRPWVEALATDYLCNRELNIPSKAAPFLRALL